MRNGENVTDDYFQCIYASVSVFLPIDTPSFIPPIKLYFIILGHPSLLWSLYMFNCGLVKKAITLLAMHEYFICFICSDLKYLSSLPLHSKTCVLPWAC